MVTSPIETKTQESEAVVLTISICSTHESRKTVRLVSRIAAVALGLVILAWGAAPAEAQRTVFNPNLTLSYLYNSNITYVGDLQESDSSVRFWVNLPVERELKTGNLDFTYTGYVERFDAFEGFDDVGHRMRFSVTTKPGRRSGFAFRVGYLRTQDQGGALIDPDQEDADPTFVLRLRRQALGATMSYEYQFSRRWYGKASLGAQAWQYDDANDDIDVDLPTTFEDRTEGRLYFQIERQVSEKTRMGARFGFRRFDLDLTGLTDAISASFIVNRAFKDRVTMSLELGGYQDSREIEGTGETTEKSGFRGSFRLDKNFRKRHLGLFAAHRLTAGGTRLGTSVNSDFRIFLNDISSRRWGWGVFIRYGRRDPDSPLQQVIDTVEGGLRVQTGVSRTLGLGFLGTYADQLQETSDRSSDFYRLAAFISWYPKGWKNLAVGSGF